MWEITLRGDYRERVVRPIAEEVTSADEVLLLAREAVGESVDAVTPIAQLRGLIATARAEPGADSAPGGGSYVPILEPIHRWASEAVQTAETESTASLREFAGGIGLIEAGELSSFAWHGDQVAVVAIPRGTETIEMLYRPVSDERERRERIANTYWKGLGVDRWWPWPEVQINADVLFFGDDPETPALAEIIARDSTAPWRYRFSLAFPAQAAGLLVVKPLYRLARNLRVRARDPLRDARVRRAEGNLGRPSPDLRDFDPADARVPVILVHGLGASAAELARMLEPLALAPARYEHDTFISIDDNAQELAGLLSERLPDADRIVIIAHSRGGLVSRAAADLVHPELARRLSIHTFGTPHLGTPLAEFGRIVPLVHFVEAVRHPGDVIRAAARYLLPRTWRIPEGIEEMSPGDAFINRMSNAPHNPVATLKGWGARFARGAAGPWWHTWFDSLCGEVLPVPHDLVVPERSSLGAGEPQGPMNGPSTHFDYLALPQIHDYLRTEVAP